MIKIETFLTKAIAAMMMVIMSFLTIVSFFEDAYFQTDYSEKIYYKPDLVVINIFFLLLLIVFMNYARKKRIIEKISIKFLLCALLVYSSTISVIWAYATLSVPRADSAFVLNSVEGLMNGNYMSLELEGYLRKYQNQIGLAFFFEIIFRLVCNGHVNYQVIRIINVVMITGIFYGMHLITKELTDDKSVIILELLLSFGWVPLMLYSVFVYGVIPGLFFSVFGILCTLRYLRTKYIGYGVGTAVLFAIATVIKQNFWIFAIAAAIILFIKAISQKRMVCIIFVILMILSNILISNSINTIYEKRSGIELTEGMPASAWIAMGMQEGSLAEGWYNKFSAETYENSQYSSRITDEISKDYIKNRFKEFVYNPKECLKFYYKKIVSQWNEATYESIWIATHKTEQVYTEPRKVIRSIYEGRLHGVVEEIMNLHQLLLYLGTALCSWELYKKRDVKNIIMILCILGGFLFHILWEAKSQYILPYVTMMLPCAAIGLTSFLKKMRLGNA